MPGSPDFRSCSVDPDVAVRIVLRRGRRELGGRRGLGGARVRVAVGERGTGGDQRRDGERGGGHGGGDDLDHTGGGARHDVLLLGLVKSACALAQKNSSSLGTAKEG